MPLTPEQQAQLPPCPFCGRAARYLPKQEGFYVESAICDTCHVSLPPAVWSRRAQLEAAQKAPGEPEFSHDPDGELCMEWYVGDATLSVSIGGVGRVSRAMLAGDKKASGARLFANERSVPVQPGIKEAALQALADQAQELGMGYEGMLMPSPPGSAGSGEQDTFQAHIANKYPNMPLDFWTRFDGVIVYKDAMVQGRWAGWTALALQPVQPDTDKLLAIIASAYQIAGAHDAPAHILDVLADPEAATVEQVEAMLPYQAAQPTPDEMIDKLRALRIALERRAPLIWDDASHDWNDACGGPPVHEIFANRLISAFFEGVPAGPDEGSDQ